MREAAQIGAFHLVGGALASPEWLADFGPVARDVELRVHQAVGVARARRSYGSRTALAPGPAEARRPHQIPLTR